MGRVCSGRQMISLKLQCVAETTAGMFHFLMLRYAVKGRVANVKINLRISNNLYTMRMKSSLMQSHTTTFSPIVYCKQTAPKLLCVSKRLKDEWHQHEDVMQFSMADLPKPCWSVGVSKFANSSCRDRCAKAVEGFFCAVSG